MCMAVEREREGAYRAFSVNPSLIIVYDVDQTGKEIPLVEFSGIFYGQLASS